MQDFVPEEVVRTPYRIDIMQPLYFVLDNINELAKELIETLPPELNVLHFVNSVRILVFSNG